MKVLAIDMGSRSIKALLLESSIRSLEVVHFDEKEVPLSEDLPSPEVLGHLLSELMRGNRYQPDAVVACMPGDEVSHKLVELPFKDKKKIDQTLLFELEDKIPFSIDDVVIDYFTSSTEGGLSYILTSHSIKENMKIFIDSLKSANLDPDIITTPPHALYNISLVRMSIPVRTAAILDIGHRRSSLALLKDGTLTAARTIMCGGFDITKSLSQVYKISLEEAEKAKIERGFILGEAPENVTEEQIQFSNVIKGALSNLIRDVNQTLLAYRAHSKHPIDVLYLSGGTALLRNITTYLYEEFQAKIQPLKIFQYYKPGSAIKAGFPLEARAAIPLGTTLGALSQIRPYKINLRKGEFAAARDRAAPLKKYKHVLLIGGIITALFSLDVGAKYYFIKNEQAKINTRLRGAVLQVFPNTPKHVLASSRKLRSFIDGQIKDQKLVTQELSEIAAPSIRSIQVLKGVSDSLPSTKIRVEEFSIANRKGRIKGIADAVSEIESFANKLEKIDYLKDVKKGEVTTAADGISKTYTITFNIGVAK